MKIVSRGELIQRLDYLQEEIERLRREVENSKIIEDTEDVKLFWQSFGSWEDDKTAEEIIEDIYKSRRSTSREIKL